MSAIPISPQEDEVDEILKRTGAHAIPTGQVAGGQTGSAIPTDVAPDASGAIPTQSHPIHQQAGVASLWSKASNIHNPVLRVLGKIGAGLARGIDVAGSIAAPGVAAMVPGSTLNADVTENRQRRQASEDTVDQERQAVTQGRQVETAEAPEKLALEGRKQKLAEQVAGAKPDQQDLAHLHAGAVQEAIEHGQDPSKSPKVQQFADAITGLQKQAAPPVERNPETQTFDSLVASGMPQEEAYRKLHPEKAPAEPGSWSLQQIGQGDDSKYVLFNSKTAQTRPAEGMVPKGTGQLTPATQGVLQQTAPVKAQVQQLLQDLEPYKDDNTPGKLAVARLGYAAGIASPEGSLGEDISKLELDRVMAGARVLKGSSRAYQALELAMKHAPNTWLDSPKLMHQKLTNILQNLDDVEKDAVKFGTKGQKGSEATAANNETAPAAEAGGKGPAVPTFAEWKKQQQPQ